MTVELERFSRNRFKKFEDLKYRRLLWGANSFVTSSWMFSMIATDKLPHIVESLPFLEQEIFTAGLISIIGISTIGYIYTNALVMKTVKETYSSDSNSK